MKLNYFSFSVSNVIFFMNYVSYCFCIEQSTQALFVHNALVTEPHVLQQGQCFFMHYIVESFKLCICERSLRAAELWQTRLLSVVFMHHPLY